MSQFLDWVDYAIVGIIAFSAIISLVRGFVREALSLTTWLLAFWIALTFSGNLSFLLQHFIESNNIRMAVSFGGLFVVTLLVGALINHLIAQLVKVTGLSGTDRLLGMVFGVARGVLLVAILMLLATFTHLPESAWWQDSVLVQQLQPVAHWVKDYLPENYQQKISVNEAEQKQQQESEPAVKQ